MTSPAESSRRRLEAARRRSADQTSDRFAELPASKPLIVTVTSVQVGASPKGNAVITVRWRDSLVVAKDYCAAYTPAPGDRVLCQVVDNQLIVVDRLAG